MGNNDKLICIPISESELSSYRKKLAKLNLEKRAIRKVYTRNVEKAFLNGVGVSCVEDIFDPLTGGITFLNEEWELIDETNLIKRLFEKKNSENELCYMLNMDGKILLRGADVYYFFSCYLSRFKYPTHRQIEVWLGNCRMFLEEARESIFGYKEDSENGYKLFLGILDNIRNMVLIFATCDILCNVDEEKYMFLEEDNVWSDHILECLELMDKVCFSDYKMYVVASEVYELIKGVLDDLHLVEKCIKKITDEYLLLKCVNPWREADNYIENYIGMMYVANELEKLNKPIRLIGILCGGIELPFILRKVMKKKTDVTVQFLFQSTGLYVEKTKKISQGMKKLDYVCAEQDDTVNVLVDENAQSGISALLAMRELNARGVSTHKLVILRNPSLARVEQLRKVKYALNLDGFDEMILGGLFPSPYTYLKKDTNYGDMYLDEMGLFSYGAEAFLKALYKNNTFIKESEVDIFKGYSKGKDESFYGINERENCLD